jgi:3-hydroxy acid dehydrogenase / malonic semialdehyde reductase
MWKMLCCWKKNNVFLTLRCFKKIKISIMIQTALITGATAGIGEATAELLVKNGYRVIITGRRKERLDAIGDRLKLQHNGRVHALKFDVRNKAAVDEAIAGLPADMADIDILINNAGLASGLDPVQDGDIEDWDKMIDTNIKGLLYITRRIVPGMIERKKGHIVNIGSIAGREVYPNGNVYCATKHAVDALTKAMRLDLLEKGIRVTQIAPGAVDTEFSVVRFHGDESKAEEVYKAYEPLQAVDVAETILFAISRPPHVNINDILVMPSAQASATAFHKDADDNW